MTTEPLDIIGVDLDGVTTPSNDGTAGSALYDVPILLNRAPTYDEARLLVDHWDSPPTFSTMHRPGIAAVRGRTLVLAGTTIEEVDRYHARTVRLAVDATNTAAADLLVNQAEAEERAAKTERDHRSHVRALGSSISFRR